MSNLRRVTLGGLAALGGLLVLVPVGRWEGERHARGENTSIARIREAVGSLEDPTGYRLLNPFTCLTYARGQRPYALELCVDGEGRVVEAIDRRDREPLIASLREEPAAATVRVARDEVDRLLRQLGG